MLLGASLLFACTASVESRSDLHRELSSVLFMNSGRVTNRDAFTFAVQAISYMEPDNVTCSNCGWAISDTWPYMYQLNSSAPRPLPNACETACCALDGCTAFLIEERADVATGACNQGAPCCWLKSGTPHSSGPKPAAVGAAVHAVSRSGTCSSSVVCVDCDYAGHDLQVVNPLAPADESLMTPPMGMRSAPALGGVSTGSMELRADGSFREWTIFNQGPAGSGKYGIVDDVFLAVRVGNRAKMLRTHPPPYARAAAIDELSFSGSYPVTRLVVSDATLPLKVAVFANSTLKPTALKESAFPAVVFTLTVENTADTDQPVAFMLNLPFGAWTDCARSSSSAVVVAAADHIGCMNACVAAASCHSWEWQADKCALNPDVPLTFHSVGSYCGVKSEHGWRLDSGSLTRSTSPEATGPSIGDMTIRAVLADGVRASFASGPDPAALYAAFAANGTFSDGAVSSVDVANGAVAVSTTVAAGATATLSIVLAWHFPDRDFSGQVLGNMYTKFWEDSAAVAVELASDAKLASVVKDINTHHACVANPDNPAPVPFAAFSIASSLAGQLRWMHAARVRYRWETCGRCGSRTCC